MMSNSYRFPFIISLLGVSLSTIIVYATGKVYPFVPGVIALAVLVLCGVQFYRNDYTSTYLLGYLLLSVFHRVFLYLYPSSFIAADSDGFALEIARLLSEGSLSAISTVFYSKAPIFIITGQISTMISGNSLRVGLVFPAIVIGFLYPLIGYIVPKYLPISNKIQVSYLTAAIIVLAPYSIRFTNNPIPQTQSVVLTLLGIILLGMYIRKGSSSFLFLILVFLFTVLITHKLAPYIITLTFIFIAGMSSLHRTPGKIEITVGVLGITMFIGLYLQAILTGFDQAVTFRILEQFGAEGTTSELAGSDVGSFTPKVAEPPISEGLLRFLPLLSHIVLMFSLAGIGWLILFRKAYHSIFAGIILFIVALETTIVLGMIGEFISGHWPRFILLMTPLLAVLTSIAVINMTTYKKLFKRKHRTVLMALLLFMFIGSQVISPAAAYDAPTQSRFYLTDSELSGKIWGLTYLQGDISTDDWLARLMPPSKIEEFARSNKGPPSRYNSVNQQILNGTLVQKNYCNIVLRPSVSRYSYQGQWKLTQPVTQGFEGYHNVYSNGDGIAVFQSPNCVSR